MPTRSSARRTQASSSAPRRPEAAGPKATSSRTVGTEQLVVGILEDDADTAADLGEVLFLDRQSGHSDGAGSGLEDAVEVQDEGGLACAVRAEQRDPLTAGDS